VDKPETLMQIYKPDIYQNKPQAEVLSWKSYSYRRNKSKTWWPV
jgi:hypothetical protein